MANRRVASVQRILEAQVANLMPVTALLLGWPRSCLEDCIFPGRMQTMRFVSSYSMHEGDRGLPHMLEFQVIAGREWGRRPAGRERANLQRSAQHRRVLYRRLRTRRARAV